MVSHSVLEIVLSSGQKMPAIGLGTATFPPVASEVVVQVVLQAIQLGYRHFDTASVYQTESTLGEAIEEAIRLGLIRSRDELFITSKLWCSDSHVVRLCLKIHSFQGFIIGFDCGYFGDMSCIYTNLQRNLKVEYLDLYLVHWPMSMRHGTYEYPPKPEDMVPMDFKSVWAAIKESQRLGLTKSIGVSNFSPQKLDHLLAFATIPPAVNQVEMNPYWQQKKLRDYCAGKGILVAAFSPLGAAGTSWGSSRVMESDVLKEIAEAKGKTVAQVCLRWAYEQGVGIVMKSYNKERLKQNFEIFNWALSDQDSKKIGEIPQSRVHKGEEFISPNGPFKTLDELWDGEL